MTRRLAIALFVAIFGSACGPDDGFKVRWTPITNLPAGAELGPNFVSLPAGTTISARATLSNANDDSCDPILTADDDQVMRIDNAERGVAVFTGVAPGNTRILATCPTFEVALDGVTTAPQSP